MQKYKVLGRPSLTKALLPPSSLGWVKAALLFVFEAFTFTSLRKLTWGQVSRLLSRQERTWFLQKQMFFTLTCYDGIESNGCTTWPLGREVVLMREIHRKHSAEWKCLPVTAVLIWPLTDPEKCSRPLAYACCTDRRLLLWFVVHNQV